MNNVNLIQTIDKTPLEDMKFDDTFEFYEITSNDEVYGINAYNYVSADSIENIVDVSLSNSNDMI